MLSQKVSKSQVIPVPPDKTLNPWEYEVLKPGVVVGADVRILNDKKITLGGDGE